MNYFFHIIIMINIYIILSLSLNLIVGMGGMLSICHAAFYGIGAYIGTLLMVNLGWTFLPALLVAIIGTAILSLIISIPSLRLKGDYFILGSMGFQSIVFILLYNWTDLTRGPYGISGIPSPSFLDLKISGLPLWFVFSTTVMFICSMFIIFLMKSPFGRTLKSIREDELAAAALGKNIPLFKIKTFALAAGFAAVAGMLFAGYMRYIDPTSFTMMESVFILSMIIIGGAGNIRGPVIGAIVLVVLPELLRFLGMPDAIAANMRQIIYGLAMIILIRCRPQGLLGDYKFT
ncbi:MAG: branched-chain amino acid ABC transporter permease [Deltaproteobacteria bacterium]|jgi:branched-chain amino acid transport system permease protein|nr:branched-chain amino acid ABC transporter permease [Deltaproteobacteria bacterium]